MPGSNAYDALINMHQTYGWAVNSKVRHPSFWLLPGDFCHMQLRARGDCLTRLQSREQAGIRGHPPRPDLQDRGIPGLSHGPSVHCWSRCWRWCLPAMQPTAMSRPSTACAA